jgi:hypothetical protein
VTSSQQWLACPRPLCEGRGGAAEACVLAVLPGGLSEGAGEVEVRPSGPCSLLPPSTTHHFRAHARVAGRGFSAASRSFKLDNRTTVICVYDVPEELRDESLLRAHFQSFGEIISLALQPDTNNFLVQFAQRFMAESVISCPPPTQSNHKLLCTRLLM